MGLCCVLNCSSRSHLPTAGKGKHLFRFPKENNKVRENWIKFVRKKDFSPKESSSICEDHFKTDCFVTKKKGRLYLVRDSVPTIYHRELTNNEIEKIEIPYDQDLQEYLDESYINNQQLDLTERENELLSERDMKVFEAKSACRFCFEKENNVKCVAISKLEAYSIDPSDVLSMFGFGTVYTELLSDIVCENCFQKLVDFDSYKNHCKKMFATFVEEIQEIDEQLEIFRKDQSAWLQDEIINNDISNEEIIIDAEEHRFDLIEEHLENEEDTYYDVYQIDDIKEEGGSKIMDVIEEEFEEEIAEDHNAGKKRKSESDDNLMNRKDIYDEEINKETIIKNPDRNSYAYRIYECFFCRLKFAGRNTYKNHECLVKEVQCEVEGCKKMFTKQSGYSQHIVKVHGHLKLSKHFCPLCKKVIVVSDAQFKQHCKQCNKEFSKKQQNIECEICQKQCKNLKSYTVHKMFHDARNNLIKNSDGKGGPVICELCGRSFTNSQGLRTHKKNVHLIDSKGEIYQCDICSKKRPTKRSLFNHMRNVHRVQETPCNVCGKVFRTKALLQKHKIYHDETKRVHFCSRCPDRLGYFTAVALRRHQKSHHISLKEYICENCECSYTSSHMLKLHQRQSHGILC